MTSRTISKSITYEQLYDLYIIQGLSRNQLRSILGLCPSAIKRLLVLHGIKKSKEQMNREREEKKKKTCLAKYGVEYVKQSEVVKAVEIANNLAKYGVEHPAKLDSVRAKIEKTCLKKYGVKSYVESEESKNRIKTLYRQGITQAKQYATKKAHNTLSGSKLEDQAFQLLLQKFPEVKRHYKSEAYPFYCDFFIPIIDTYIELNLYWTHGRHPFDPNSKIDQEKLIKWKDKGYNKAIEKWTRKDPLKRKIAQDQGLNYKEFFSYKELECWVDQLD